MNWSLIRKLLFINLRNQFNLIIKSTNYLALSQLFHLQSLKFPLLFKDFLHILTQISGGKNVLGFYFRLVFFMLFYVSLYPLFCFILSALLLFWLTSLFHPLWLSSLPLAHSSLCHCLVFSLVLSLSRFPFAVFFFCFFVLLFRSLFALFAFFLLLFCCLCVLSRMFFFGAGYSLHSYSPARVLSFSLLLYCQCLWLCALSVCCCCCLLEVKDKLMNDLIFCNSLYTIILYIFFLLLLSLRGRRKGLV